MAEKNTTNGGSANSEPDGTDGADRGGGGDGGDVFGRDGIDLELVTDT